MAQGARKHRSPSHLDLAMASSTLPLAKAMVPRSHRLCLDVGSGGTLISESSGRGASGRAGALPAAGPGPAGPAGPLAHHRPSRAAAGGARGEVSGGWRGTGPRPGDPHCSPGRAGPHHPDP